MEPDTAPWSFSASPDEVASSVLVHASIRPSHPPLMHPSVEAAAS